MIDTVIAQATDTGSHVRHPTLARLFSASLLQTILERRTRRVSRGTSVRWKTTSYSSPHAPQPLSPIEEDVLIVIASGITGVVRHDGPLAASRDEQELATPFLNLLGRSASSPDNSQPTHFVMINDHGVWLIRRPGSDELRDVWSDLPLDPADWAEMDWHVAAGSVRHRLSTDRLDFPRRFPFYLGWNKQLSNRPGTTLFLPLVDCTRMCINGILNLCDERDGERPMFVDDWQPFRARSFLDLAGSVLARLRGTPIPYQIIGGIRRLRSGTVNPEIPAPLGVLRMMFADHEAHFLLQNLMLVAQALDLGAWVHVCPPSPLLFTGDGREHRGLGMMQLVPTDREWRRQPPLPATQPNPVGIDGVLEGLCPPYVASMEDAVDRLLREKQEHAYGRPNLLGAAVGPALADEFPANARTYSDTTIRYAKEICSYVYETYGRFPAHVDAFHVPGTWLQLCHVEEEYYRDYRGDP